MTLDFPQPTQVWVLSQCTNLLQSSCWFSLHSLQQLTEECVEAVIKVQCLCTAGCHLICVDNIIHCCRTQLTSLTAVALTLQIQRGKCYALGEFLTKLWPAIQVCTARVVLVTHVDNNLIRNSPSAQHFLLWICKVNANSSTVFQCCSQTISHAWMGSLVNAGLLLFRSKCQHSNQIALCNWSTSSTKLLFPSACEKFPGSKSNTHPEAMSCEN